MILNIMTQGEFYRHTIAYNVLPYSLRTTASYFRALILLHPVFIGGAIACSVYTLFVQKTITLPVLYTVLASLTAFTVGRTGSSINHLLECIAGIIILFGIGWGAMERQEAPRWKASIPLLLSAQLLWPFAFPHTPLVRYYQPTPIFGYNPTAADAQACSQLDQYVEAARGPILAEDVAIVVSHNREAIGNSWVFNVLRNASAIAPGYARLQDDIEQRRFALVLLHWQSYPPDILNNVAAHYHKQTTIPCIYHWDVYLP